MKPSNTIAIVQARMGSSRLPGKVLMKIGRRTMLGYLIERISGARTVTSSVIATTTHHRDDAIAEEARRLGVECFRGSEDDVLERYVQAARIYDAGIIVRVTGDNPFTDPASIDRVVRCIGEGYDYAIENDLPAGTTGEALTIAALEFINHVATTRQWREHVTLYAKENRHMLHTAFLQPPECSRPDLSFTVDHPKEYEYVRDLAKNLKNPHFLLKDLITLADTPIVV